jgi:hypothetical protein
VVDEASPGIDLQQQFGQIRPRHERLYQRAQLDKPRRFVDLVKPGQHQPILAIRTLDAGSGVC